MALRNIYVDEETFNRLREFKGVKKTFTEVINSLLDEKETSSIVEEEKDMTVEVF
ncbi:MAG: hypothetical protein GF311_03580 [Candidatus Lokiarchaeota archaeon]|jgi:predicted CopG family antitoxin|nr:hypothetical protein [Candidatus Lokiarchaeota archaeon]